MSTVTGSSNRITGVVSGMDTDTLVKNLLKSDQQKVDRTRQNRQLTEWQKDSYKEFSSLLRGLQSEYFDVIKPSTNLRSKAMFNVYTASVTASGTATTKVSAATSSDSAPGVITIDSITRLASKDTWRSEAVGKLEGDFGISYSAINQLVASGKGEFKMSIDGTQKTLSLSGGYSSVSDVVSDLQTKIDAAFGAGISTVTASSDVISFSGVGHSISLGAGGEYMLETLGFVDGDSNGVNTSSTLSTLFGVTDSDLDFAINGVTSSSMGITSAMTVKEMMEAVNASEAGVTLAFSSFSNKFTMTANGEGVVNNITLTDTDSFFSDSLMLASTGDRDQGVDALFTMNGVATSRASNTFAVDGTTLTLNETGTNISVGIKADAGNVVSTIKTFIEKYNELIGKITEKTTEKRYQDYRPLTDEEKESMSDEDIKLWETKAKSGLLRGDSTLLALQNKMRRAISDSVEGVGLTLKEIGISTSANYMENGKLVLDETKLKDAFSQKPSKVIEMFSKQSSYDYTDGEHREDRYNGNGIANRLNDLMNDYVRLSRDSNGNKGILIEKAGPETSGTEVSSQLAKKIIEYDEKINNLLELLSDHESKYYTRFAAMEAALQKMNAQASSLASKLGG